MDPQKSALDKLAHWRDNSETALGRLPMPPELYASDHMHALEMERIFRKEWICCGHISQLKNSGDYLTIDIAGHPVIVVRDQTAEIRAYSNVCRHRSSRLLDGCGNVKLIVCPYHAWAYNLDGNLRGAPHMASEQVSGICLNALKLEIWNGLVFVNLDEHSEPLAPRLEGLNSAISHLNFASMDVVHCYDGEIDCNWKVLVENFCESYHLFRVHKTTLEPETPTSSVIVMPAGPGYNHHTLDVLSGKDDKPNKEHLSGIYPTTTFAISNGWVLWLSIIPVRFNKLEFRAWIAKEPVKGDDHALAEEDLERILAFMAEDKIINTGVQKGLETGVGNRGPLHEFEKTNWDFGHYYANKMLR